MAFSSLRHGVVAILALAGLAILSSTGHQYDADVLHLHKTITTFNARGQSTVELFAPFSTIITSSLKGVLFDVIFHSLWPVVKFVFVATLFKSVSPKRAIATLVAFVVAIEAVLKAPVETSESLAMSNTIADALLIIALLTASTEHSLSPSPTLEHYKLNELGEILVLASSAFGGSHIDTCAAYALIFVSRCKSVASRVADVKRSAIRVTADSCLNISFCVVICPIMFLAICGTLAPHSEAAGGGNYNLRFYSPSSRRELSPFTPNRPTSEQTEPSYGVRPGTMYTFYIPEAGFLWSDGMVWSQRQLPSAETSESPNTKEEWSSDGSSRVFFQDKFGERHAWRLEMSTNPGHRLYENGAIRSGSTLRLHDSFAKQDLCVTPRQPVYSESLYLNATSDERPEHDRIRVGTFEGSTPADCHWSIYYDPHYDEGFLLYNEIHECTLATTFRSLPADMQERSNDTVILVLNLKLEAGCTKGANAASSRIFAIERESDGRESQTQTTRPPWSLGHNFVRNLIRGCQYFDARRRLATFRHNYRHQQEIGFALGHEKYAEPRNWHSKMMLSLCSIHVVLWLVGIAARQRYTILEERWHDVMIGAFVLVHLFNQLFIGKDIVHSSRAAAIISFHSILKIMLRGL